MAGEQDLQKMHCQNLKDSANIFCFSFDTLEDLFSSFQDLFRELNLRLNVLLGLEFRPFFNFYNFLFLHQKNYF